MKKINLIILLLLGTSSLFAKNSFGSSDLNQNDELLFTVSQNQEETLFNLKKEKFKRLSLLS